MQLSVQMIPHGRTHMWRLWDSDTSREMMRSVDFDVCMRMLEKMEQHERDTWASGRSVSCSSGDVLDMVSTRRLTMWEVMFTNKR